MVAAHWILQNKPPQLVDKWFRKLQLLSAAAYSLGHGGNDAQKTMGIVAGALYTAGFMSKSDMLGNWGRYRWPIILAAHAAIAAGTYFGGWRIVHTMGQKITKLKPLGGFCAESAGAITLFGTALAGHPGQHHAHHHRRDRRRRRNSPAVCRSLGRRRTHRLGLDADHSRLRRSRGGTFLLIHVLHPRG